MSCSVINTSLRNWIHPEKTSCSLHPALTPALKTDLALKLHCPWGAMTRSSLWAEKRFGISELFETGIGWISTHDGCLGLTFVDLQGCDDLPVFISIYCSSSTVSTPFPHEEESWFSSEILPEWLQNFAFPDEFWKACQSLSCPLVSDSHFSINAGWNQRKQQPLECFRNL